MEYFIALFEEDDLYRLAVDLGKIATVDDPERLEI